MILLLSVLLAQADPPGTVKMVSKSTFLIDSASGDAYFITDPETPAKFTVVGPTRVQVDFRVNMPKKKAKDTRAVLLEVVADGRTLSKLRINAKTGRSQWRSSEVSYKPSEAAEFFIDFADGFHEVEFRVDPAAKLGGALYLVDSAQASRPLAADAPALKVGATEAKTAEPTPLPTEPKPEAKPSEAAPRPAEQPSEKPIVAKPDEPAPEVKETPKPQQADPKEPAQHMLSAFALGGVVVQEEKLAFGRQGAGEVSLRLQVALAHNLYINVGWDGRIGQVSVPLTTGGGPLPTPEARHGAWLSFAWSPNLWKSGDNTLSASIGAYYRLTAFSNQIAPALVGFVGGDVGLYFSRGFATLFINGGFAPRIHDSTPADAALGNFVGRAHWQLGARANILPMLGVIVAYRGELLLRTGSYRQSDGLHTGLVLSFL